MIKIIALLSGFLFQNPISDNPECGSFSVAVSIRAEQSGAQVRFSPSGGLPPYRVVFFRQSGELISDDFDRQVHERIPAGQYQCVVIDGRNCRKNLIVNVP